MNLTNLLQDILQDKTSPGMAPETIILPTSQKLYEVDLSTRTISGPETLSVQSDHYAETVYFLVDRFYDHMDLSQTNCVIQYVINGESYVYAVPFCDITTYEGKMVIPWSISLSATKNSGNIKYFMKFYLLEKESNNSTNKVGNNNVILTNKNKEEIRTLYPIHNHKENLYRNFFSENQILINNQINFLTKNYRPKCDLCTNLCDIDWYILRENHPSEIDDIYKQQESKNMMLICDNCYEKGDFPLGLSKEDFELSNVYNIFVPNDKFNCKLKERLDNEKWTEEDTDKLLNAIQLKGEGNWDEIVKVFDGKKTKSDCIMHLLQLPIKESISFRVSDLKQNKTELNTYVNCETNAVTDQNNPLIGQIVFFSKMFEKFSYDDAKKNNIPSIQFIKENIYNIYSKNIEKEQDKIIDKEKEEEKEKKDEIKKILNFLVYLQMEKVDMKLNHYANFEKLIEQHKTQLKSMESQIIQDRIKLSIKKAEIFSLIEKIKEEKNKKEQNTDNENSDKNSKIDIEKENIET